MEKYLAGTEHIVPGGCQNRIDPVANRAFQEVSAHTVVRF